MTSKSVKSKCFASKYGIVSTLVWETFILSLIYFFIDSIGASYTNFIAIGFGLAAGLGIFIYPIFGWLGDSVIGRYKAVKYSLLILWAVTILYGIVELLMDQKRWELPVITGIFSFIVLSISGCFIVNNLHFGIDQLADAPSWQVSSYISWYCWSFFLAIVVKSLAFECTIKNKYIHFGFVAVILTIALCMDALCNRHLVVEPTSSNSLKVEFHVLSYALKNKYPRLRSAYSFWHGKMSRINLAKARYGGPFTSEEVEDVKTFFKMLLIIPVGSVLPGCFLNFKTISGQTLMYHYSDSSYVESHQGMQVFQQCLIRGFVYSVASYFIVIGVSIYEFILYPLLWKHIASITITKKLVTGMSFLFVTQLSYLALEVTGHIIASKGNITIPCFFNSSESTLASNETLSLSFFWLCIPSIFNAVAYYLMFTSGMELLCAQSPYSMKGLLMGWMWSTYVASNLMNVGLKYVFSFISIGKYLSCGVSYFLFSSIITGVLVIIVCIILIWYSKRRRRDNIEDECMDAISTGHYQACGSSSH